MIDIPSSVLPLLVALVTLGGVTLTTVGGVIGHVLSSRAQRRAAEIQGEAARSTADNALIDQLQEELQSYRDASSERMTQQDARMNRLETYSDGYRNHAHELRAHIWDGKPPPPPKWPEGLPR